MNLRAKIEETSARERRYAHYATLKQRIVPWLRFNQSIYEDVVSARVSRQTIWLDAGCGKHILPPWRQEAERALILKAKLAVGCDLDEVSLRKHSTLGGRLCVADLECLPFRTGSVSLITCDMVVEHLERPLPVFAEFARILADGGRVIVHTPNAYSHFVVGSRFLPRSLKLATVKHLDGRSDDDVFRTRYRANTPLRLRVLMARVGLEEEWHRMLASEATLALAHPLLAALELLYIRLTLRPMLRRLRVSILASFSKNSLPRNPGNDPEVADAC